MVDVAHVYKSNEIMSNAVFKKGELKPYNNCCTVN